MPRVRGASRQNGRERIAYAFYIVKENQEPRNQGDAGATASGRMSLPEAVCVYYCGLPAASLYPKAAGQFESAEGPTMLNARATQYVPPSAAPAPATSYSNASVLTTRLPVTGAKYGCRGAVYLVRNHLREASSGILPHGRPGQMQGIAATACGDCGRGRRIGADKRHPSLDDEFLPVYVGQLSRIFVRAEQVTAVDAQEVVSSAHRIAQPVDQLRPRRYSPEAGRPARCR